MILCADVVALGSLAGLRNLQIRKCGDIEDFSSLSGLVSLETLHVCDFYSRSVWNIDHEGLSVPPFVSFAKNLTHHSRLESLTILQERGSSQDLFQAFPHLVDSLMQLSRMQKLVLRWGTENNPDFDTKPDLEYARARPPFLVPSCFLSDEMAERLAETTLNHLDFMCFDTKITGSFLQAFAKRNRLQTLTLHAMTSLSLAEYKDHKDHDAFREYKSLDPIALLRRANAKSSSCDPTHLWLDISHQPRCCDFSHFFSQTGQLVSSCQSQILATDLL